MITMTGAGGGSRSCIPMPLPPGEDTGLQVRLGSQYPSEKANRIPAIRSSYREFREVNAHQVRSVRPTDASVRPCCSRRRVAGAGDVVWRAQPAPGGPVAAGERAAAE